MGHENTERATFLGYSQAPPASPWGINIGGGLNSTAVVLECMRRGHQPDWMLFADTGSERPETIQHVEWLRAHTAGWCDLTIVRWVRQDGTFEPLHENCLRTNHFPSKAYGFAGCTTKWKVQPMERWRKANGFDRGAFAVGYDAGETRRLSRACQRGDDPNMIAWYPLAAWGIDRAGCAEIVAKAGITVAKSSCFMCPNMTKPEWAELQATHPDLYATAEAIERGALAAGNNPQAGRRSNLITEDRCKHGGCFT
jgi:hypothetical protein